MNQVVLIGNLGGDPELRYTQSKKAVANFTMATKNFDGSTEWHRIITWNKQAENVNQYLRKGSKVAISGEIHTREWKDKDGNKRYTTEVTAMRIEFLDNRKDSSVEKEEPEPMDKENWEEMPSEMPSKQKIDDDLPF